MDKNKVLGKINKIKELTTPPTVLQSVLDLINSPDSSAKELSDVILKDPGLTAQVLRMANSSFYAYYKKITTVNQAVVVMGINAVKYFILSVTVLNHLNTRREKSKINLKCLWTHFLEVACASRKLAEAIGYKMPEEAYVAGILHDVGIIILEREFPEDYLKVIRLAANGKELTEAEIDIFGVDHQEIGGYLTNYWNMPQLICESITMHHPKNDSQIAAMSDIAKIVILANCIASVPFEELKTRFNAERKLNLLNIVSGELKINSDILMNVHRQMAVDAASSAVTMNMDIGDALEILSRSNSELFTIYLDLAALFKERRELSKEIIIEERMQGTLESLKIALATLSHYINNSTMNIQGKCEMLNMLHRQGEYEKINFSLPAYIDSIQMSIKRISLVLEELSHLSSIDTLNFFSHSRAIDIENNIKNKLASQLECIK
ncbi:MAG: HDOD domain-containing protein [candidate division Zixibacteria bacterium]|jgi:HD-like signal output (HDOD) protein|nr:HDOD domain-containing protein [candidate division Zixibacteria bacterium]